MRQALLELPPFAMEQWRRMRSIFKLFSQTATFFTLGDQVLVVTLRTKSYIRSVFEHYWKAVTTRKAVLVTIWLSFLSVRRERWESSRKLRLGFMQFQSILMRRFAPSRNFNLTLARFYVTKIPIFEIVDWRRPWHRHNGYAEWRSNWTHGICRSQINSGY